MSEVKQEEDVSELQGILSGETKHIKFVSSHQDAMGPGAPLNPEYPMATPKDVGVTFNNSKFTLVDEGSEIVLEQVTIKVKLMWYPDQRVVELKAPKETGWTRPDLVSALRREFAKEGDFYNLRKVWFLTELKKQGGNVFTVGLTSQNPKQASVGSVTVSGSGQAAGIVHGGMIMHQGPKQEGHWHY